jgi:hypothetical protein
MPRLVSFALSKGSDGHLEILATSNVVDSQPTVWRSYEFADGAYTGWEAFGRPGRGMPTQVSVTPHVTDGRLEAFVATERDKAVWHRWQTGPGISDWSQWEFMTQLDQSIQAGPLATGLTDGRLMAMVVPGSSVEHAIQWQAGDEDWPPWSSLGNPTARPIIGAAVAPRAREIPELFVAVETSGAAQAPTAAPADLWHRYQFSPDEWSPWQPLGHPAHTAGAPTVAVNHDDRLEVFSVDGVTGRLWHSRQSTVGDPRDWGAWATVADSGSSFTQVAAELDASGRLVVAAITFGSDVWTTRETAPGAGTFSQWAKLGDVPPAEQPGTTEGVLTSPALVCDRRGLMQCFVTDHRTGALYQFSAATADDWQPVSGAAWQRP